MIENRRYGHALKWLVLILCLITTISAFPIEHVEASNQVRITLDGKQLNVPNNVTTIKDGRVFVPLRFIAEEMGTQVVWIGSQKKVTLSNSNNKVELTIGSLTYWVNGQAAQVDVPPFIYNNRTVVPLRFIANGLELGVKWDPATQTAILSTSGVGDERFVASRSREVTTFSDDQLYWLAKIIYAESRGEPILGQVAVGAVIMNRVKNPNFPNTIYGVIFDKWGAYYQFEPVQNGSIHRLEPNSTAYEAARRALGGEDPTKGSLYFHNPQTSKSDWMASKRVAVRIGKHDFLY